MELLEENESKHTLAGELISIQQSIWGNLSINLKKKAKYWDP